MNEPFVTLDLRIKTESDTLSKPSAPTFRPDERKRIIPPVGNIKTTKHPSTTTAASSNDRNLFKRDLLGKSQSSKAEVTLKPSRQSKSKASKDKKPSLIASDSDDEKDDAIKALGSSGKKVSTRPVTKTLSKKPDTKTLAKSRSPTKPETPKTKTVYKSANLNATKNVKLDTTKSLSQSQAAIERENQLQEEYIKLKLKSKEMKNTLQEYADKFIGLEDELKEKDQQLQELQQQLRDSQNERIQNLDTLRDFAKKEEQWLRTERELKSLAANREEVEFQQQRKLEELDSLLRKTEQRYLSPTQSFHPDGRGGRDDGFIEQNRVLEALRVELETVRKESRLKDSRILELETANAHKTQELNRLKEQMESAERSNRGTTAKIDELKEAKMHLEEKVNRLKKKLEDERNKFQNEKKAEIDEKKNKIKQLKTELKQAEASVQKLTEEKKVLEFEVEKQASVNAALERSLERAKDEIIELQQQQYALSFNYVMFIWHWEKAKHSVR